MRKCTRGMPCVKGVFRYKCKVDEHFVKLGEECGISDDNPKLLELFPITGIMEICENCSNYEPMDDWVYEGSCPESPGEFRRSFDGCGKFSPKKSVLEAAAKERFAPWDRN